MTAQAAAAQSMSTRNWVMLLLLGAIWGGSFFFASIAVTEIPPLVLVLFRVAIASAALWVYIAARRIPVAPAIPFVSAFFGLALLNNIIPFTLMFTGQTAIGAGLASVLNATTPFWTMLLANALLADERLTPARTLGVLLGIAGTAVMVGPGLLANLGGPVWAKLALLGTALSYACAAIFARRFRALPPELIATGQLTASTVVMIPVTLLLYDPATMFSASAGVWAAVLALALLATAFAYILFFSVLSSAGPSNASLVTLIVPVSAILLGAVFLGERVELFEIAGMVLIGVGLVVIDGRLLRR